MKRYILAIILLLFLTMESKSFSQSSDVESVQIGNQIWMSRNIDVTHYQNGDPILHAQTEEEWEQAGEQGVGAWCNYDNDPENGKIYGKLYNWYAVNDPRGLAPEGWRVASDEDWIILEIELGMTQEVANSWIWRGKPVAAKLVGNYELLTTGILPNHKEFNSSGFCALLAGYSYYGYSTNLGFNAYWWTSTEYSSTNAITRNIFHYSTDVSRHYSFKGHGYSVRCISD